MAVLGSGSGRRPGDLGGAVPAGAQRPRAGGGERNDRFVAGSASHDLGVNICLDLTLVRDFAYYTGGVRVLCAIPRCADLCQRPLRRVAGQLRLNQGDRFCDRLE